MTSTSTRTIITEDSLTDDAESWYHALNARHLSPATRKAYQASVSGFLTWHATRYPDAEPILDKAAVRLYIGDLTGAGQRPGTLRLRSTALKLFSAFLARDDITSEDALKGLELPQNDHPVVPTLTDDELARLLHACKGTDFASRRDEAITRIMSSTGLRAGELISLRVADVDLHEMTITVRKGKGGKGRRVGVGPVAARSLDRYLRARRLHKLAHIDDLWLGEQGREFHYQGLAKALRVRAEAAGIQGFHPHRLRHTFATRWLRAGGSEDGLMATAGWTTREMIVRYTSDTSQERARTEAGRLRLDDV